MKKAIIIVIILLVLVVAGVFGWMCVASNIANTVYQRIEKYKFDVNNLESEKLFDFSTSRYFNQDKVSEGIIHKDSNQKISIISNLKVLGMYCEYDSQMNCGFSKSRTGHTDNVSKKQSYAIGDGVRLRDLSSWHVISDSSEYSDYITLIRDERLDINGDGVVITTGTVDNPDRIPFDKEGSNKYSVDSPSNVGYYLNVTYKDSLNYDDIVEIRLPYKEEIDHVKSKIGFDSVKGLSQSQLDAMFAAEEEVLGSIHFYEDSDTANERLKDLEITAEQYEKLMPHWLYNDFSGNYFIHPYQGGIYTEVWNGTGIIRSRAKSPFSLKPVIVVNKSNIYN